MQRRSGKCNVAQKGAAWPSDKVYALAAQVRPRREAFCFWNLFLGNLQWPGGGLGAAPRLAS